LKEREAIVLEPMKMKNKCAFAFAALDSKNMVERSEGAAQTQKLNGKHVAFRGL